MPNALLTAQVDALIREYGVQQVAVSLAACMRQRVPQIREEWLAGTVDDTAMKLTRWAMNVEKERLK